MPWWKTDKAEYILKVKDKFVNVKSDLLRGNLYSINVDFEFYSFENEEDKTIKGYYSKVKDNECQEGLIEVVCDEESA